MYYVYFFEIPVFKCQAVSHVWYKTSTCSKSTHRRDASGAFLPSSTLYAIQAKYPQNEIVETYCRPSLEIFIAILIWKTSVRNHGNI